MNAGNDLVFQDKKRAKRFRSALGAGWVHSGSTGLTIDLEPEVQVGTTAMSSGFPCNTVMHTNISIKVPGVSN